MANLDWNIFKGRRRPGCIPCRQIFFGQAAAQQCTAMHNSAQQCTAMHNSAQQCTTMLNNAQQCTTMQPQEPKTHCSVIYCNRTLHCVSLLEHQLLQWKLVREIFEINWHQAAQPPVLKLPVSPSTRLMALSATLVAAFFLNFHSAPPATHCPPAPCPVPISLTTGTLLKIHFDLYRPRYTYPSLDQIFCTYNL